MRRTELTLILVALLALAVAAQPALGKAPEVLFSDAWFGTETEKIEVAPGDQGVQLVVRLINAWNMTYRYAEGYVILPDGFTDAVTGESKTRTYAVESPIEGGYFYMKFIINIADNVELGEHKAKMLVRYVFWDEEDIEHVYLYIKFRVTGKIELIPSLSVNEIEPAKVSRISLKLANTGSAAASSVEVRVESATNGLAILSGYGRHVLGDIAPGEAGEIPLLLLASRSLADGVADLKLMVNYLDSYGNPKQEEFTLSLRVKPLGGVGVTLDAYITEPILKPSAVNPLRVVVVNRGTEPAESVDAVITMPSEIQPPITLLKGPTAVKLGTINPGEEKVVDLEVFANSLAAGGAYVIPIKLTYVDDEGRHTEERSLTITVAEESKKNKLSIYCSEYVKGGVVEEAEVKVKNIAGEILRDITLTISPEAEWVTLLGPTTWHIDSLRNGEEKVLKLEMYVPSETPSGTTIGEPFNLKVDVSFEDSSGLVKDEQHILGMYVRGIIDVKLQEVSLEKLGEEFYLVGRLLNEGTETALYTRVKIIDGDISSTSTSYLGDLDPNAPLLFSIPIEVLASEPGAKAGVKLQVTYMNSLRERGETILEAEVQVPQPVQSESQASTTGLPIPSTLLVILGAVIAAAAVAAYLLRRRKGSEVP